MFQEVQNLVCIVRAEAVLSVHTRPSLKGPKLGLTASRVSCRIIFTCDEIIRSEEIRIVCHVRSFVGNRFLQTLSAETRIDPDLDINRETHAVVRRINGTFYSLSQKVAKTDMNTVVVILCSNCPSRCSHIRVFGSQIFLAGGPPFRIFLFTSAHNCMIPLLYV